MTHSQDHGTTPRTECSWCQGRTLTHHDCSRFPSIDALVGVDCGNQGAIALLVDNQPHTIRDMPLRTETVNGKTRRTVDAVALEELLVVMRNHDPYTIAIERPQPRPGNSAQGAFASGRSFGTLETVAAGLGYLLTLIPPQTWKRDLGLSSDKQQSVDLACELWPDHRDQFHGPRGGLMDGRAEAALIAWWTRTKREAATQ